MGLLSFDFINRHMLTELFFHWPQADNRDLIITWTFGKKKFIHSYLYECRCVSSCRISDEIFYRNIDKDTAEYQNGSGDELIMLTIV